MLGAVRTARLLGRSHHRYGHVACISEGAAAIALSRGGAPKPYRHTEPNEDAACFAIGPAGTLLAVADGHAGAQASQLAIARLLEAGAAWVTAGVAADDWPGLARSHVADTHAAILRAGTREGFEARTTLAFALLQPAAGIHGWCAIGDSHVFAVGDATHELASREEGFEFLGSPGADGAHLALQVGCADATALGALVLATDGLSERGIGVPDPAAAVGLCGSEVRDEAPERRPLALARGVAEAANAAHAEQRAGDNVATAVCWLAGAALPR